MSKFNKNNLKIKRAIISVFDKTSLKYLVPYFEEFNIEVFSTGGTFNSLKRMSKKLKLFEISNFTKSPEILDGRVKTLHPNIHAGILADMSNQTHLNQIKKMKVKSFDLVIINFYPFESIINQKNKKFEECIEFIDVGGPTMMRAAAKNFKNTTIISSNEQINDFIKYAKQKKNIIGYDKRMVLAGEAFSISSQYELAISEWFKKETKQNESKKINLWFPKIKNLRYGENPHQNASLYKISNNEINQISGKNISYNNINDMDVAINLALELEKYSCIIVKHGNPCGASIAKNQQLAYKKSLNSDPISAFGGIIAFNTEVEENTAKLIKKRFNEVVIAPKFSTEAKIILKEKKNLILIEYIKKTKSTKQQFKSTKDFLLVQDYNSRIINSKNLKFVTEKKPSTKQIKDLLFAFSVSKYVNSNAIVLAKNLITTGIGVGQTNRLDSSKHAIEKHNQLIKTSSGKSSLASDGFFPFPDIIELCKKNNIDAIIQPGGSLNDKKIIEKANQYSISMVFSGIRHFKH